jgi:hypothetical protein
MNPGITAMLIGLGGLAIMLLAMWLISPTSRRRRRL